MYVGMACIVENMTSVLQVVKGLTKELYFPEGGVSMIVILGSIIIIVHVVLGIFCVIMYCED